MYHPSQMYWVADDGRIYSGPRQRVVAADDADYLAWRASGLSPRPWPRDSAGAQTDAALQEVLAPYGMWVDLAGYAADARWRREVRGIIVSGLPVATDDRSKLMIAGARIKADADPSFTTLWNGVTPLTAAQIIAISDAVLSHVDRCFAICGSVLAAISAGTITTREQVDAAFASI